jgi:hypothetical protein
MTVTKSPGAGASLRPGHKSPLRAATLGGMAPAGSGLTTAEILTAGARLRREALSAPDLRRMQISEFTVWLRSRTNKHHRPFQADTIAAYADAARVGVEAYTAFALHVWLTSNPVVSDRTRGFARWSAIVALVLGMAGQVAYHLLSQAGVIRAPWVATTLVSCLPVLVLGMGSALAHMLRSDAAAAGAPAQFPASLISRKDGSGQHPADQSLLDRPVPADVAAVFPEPGFSDLRNQHGDGRGAGKLVSYPGYGARARPPARTRLPDAYSAAAEVIASGQQISRRSLRSAGLHGSNADLGMLARLVRTSPDGPRC